MRVVRDPHYSNALQWRMNGFVLEYRFYFMSAWAPYAETQLTGFYGPTPERRALWRELFLNPCET